MYRLNSTYQEHMINSLLKDSHITRKSRSSKSHLLQSGVPLSNYKSVATNRTMNSSDIIVKKPAEITFSGLSLAEKLCDRKDLLAKLIKAGDNQIVFNSAFALLLTALLRPATICALPGKKNKDDKKYAAAHSVASGVIGFGLAYVFANPISAAVGKLLKAPKDFISAKNASRLIKDTDLSSSAKTYLNQIADILISSPKAILTIAIIPPILKYVFGLQKKSVAKLQAEQTYPLLNFKGEQFSHTKSLQNFMGGTN